MASKGIRSVAAEGFQAPGVVVSYTDDDGMHTGKSFIAQGFAGCCRRAASAATNRLTSRPSAWVCSAWTSGTTLTALWPT